ncbi:hypothetical protein KAJ27_24505 [bacterium]|nr:hypothetical protein [bacterium]
MSDNKFKFSFQHDNGLYFVPICHYSMEFAEVIRQAVKEVQPDCIAIELPESLGEVYKTAVLRLPVISIILYQTSGETYYLPIEPTDPFSEAVRTAQEKEIPLEFIDLDVEGYPQHNDVLPDHYSITQIGYKEYVTTCTETVEISSDNRDRYMAYRINNLIDDNKKILVICGMFHYKPILRELQNAAMPFVKSAKKEEIRICDLHEESVREVSSEMPFLMSAYEAARDIEVYNSRIKEEEKKAKKVIDLSERLKSKKTEDVKTEIIPIEEKPESPKLHPDISKLIKKILSSFKGSVDLTDAELDPELWFPERMFKTEQQAKPKMNVRKFRMSSDRRSEILELIKTLHDKKTDQFLDRIRINYELIKQSEKFYFENTGEEIKKWQRRVLLKFSRNCALVTGRLVPSFFDLIVAARSVADDNYAYEFWDLGSYYPWFDDDSKYVKIKVSGDTLWQGTRKIRFRRKFPRKERLHKIIAKGRKNEKNPGDWERSFTDEYICSYPKEDIVLEKYGDFLKKKSINHLSDLNTKIEPFTTTLLDGVDMRTTVRNWFEKKLYVKEIKRVGGGADSVVVIFDEDPDDLKYPWKMTWLGEHNQESDMAFYSTSIYSKIVGPGVARCEHGGFALVYPPMRMFDVWSDPVYHIAKSKAEVLLLAALDYSLEKYVIYVAAKPPRSYFKTLAGRLGKKIHYIPIGQLSPQSLKQIRVFHILSTPAVRKYAKDFIW